MKIKLLIVALMMFAGIAFSADNSITLSEVERMEATIEEMREVLKEYKNPNPLDSIPLQSHEPMYFVLNPNDGEEEAKFQISLKYPVTDWLPGLYFSMTTIAFWDLHSESKPFTATNYNPSIFYTFWETDKETDGFSIEKTTIGYEHQSNGESDVESRSWERFFVESGISHKLNGDFLSFIHKKENAFWLDENADIKEYYGDSRTIIKWNHGDNIQLDWTFRRNASFERGHDIVGLSFKDPWLKLRPWWYIQAFSGYGEHLLNYNKRNSEIRIGFLLVR